MDVFRRTCLACSLLIAACGGDDGDSGGGIDAAVDAIDAASAIDAGNGNPAAIPCDFPQTLSLTTTLHLCDLSEPSCRSFAPVIFPVDVCESADVGLNVEFLRDPIDSTIILNSREGWTFVSTSSGNLPIETRLQPAPGMNNITAVLDDGSGAQYELVFVLDGPGSMVTITSFTAL